jgi:preprotein translocase subunit SecE
VIFSYLAAAVLLWATLAKLLAALAYLANVPDPPLLGSNFTLANLLGLAVAAGAAVYAFRNERAHEFSTEVVVELRKVTWPSRKETRTATIVVIIATIIVSLILGFFDLVWAKLTGIIYNKG